MHAFNFKAKNLWQVILFISGAFLLYNCDVLDSDVAPKPDELKVVQNKVYVMSNGTSTIDLRSMVQTAGSIQLNITSQPQKGELSTLAPGLLQYSPNTSFVQGQDKFKFSIYSASNTLLKEDSVIIVVENDTTNLPCGLYAQNDYLENVTGLVSINVLANDYFCGDSSKLAVEIYRPEGYYPPYHGSAQVVGNRIEYTPGVGFEGYDKIAYKVFNTENDSIYSFAIVYIEKPQACEFMVNVDSFSFGLDSLQLDTVYLPIFDNDQLCGQPITGFDATILEDGDEGTGTFKTPWAISYKLPSPRTAFTDSLVYQLCKDVECQTAKVYITVK
jgi:hypothetical protein